MCTVALKPSLFRANVSTKGYIDPEGLHFMVASNLHPMSHTTRTLASGEYLYFVLQALILSSFILNLLRPFRLNMCEQCVSCSPANSYDIQASRNVQNPIAADR